MYTSPSYSGVHSPKPISTTSSVRSSAQSVPPIPNQPPNRKRKRDHSPDPTSICSLDNWETFPWHTLNTSPSKLNRTTRRPTASLQDACLRQLALLTAGTHKTPNLTLILSGIRSLISQPWETLLVYFNEEVTFPHCERPWSHKEWRKWEVVEFLTRIAGSYYEGCDRAGSEGAVLETKDVDEVLLALVRDLYGLGVGAEGGVVVVKEWERPGTLWVMELEGVGYGYEESRD